MIVPSLPRFSLEPKTGTSQVTPKRSTLSTYVVSLSKSNLTSPVLYLRSYAPNLCIHKFVNLRLGRERIIWFYLRSTYLINLHFICVRIVIIVSVFRNRILVFYFVKKILSVLRVFVVPFSDFFNYSIFKILQINFSFGICFSFLFRVKKKTSSVPSP